MKRALSILTIAVSALAAGAQANGAFPQAVFAAKTIAIVNDTNSGPISDGATSALKAWGQYTLVDDPENADITLRFDKSKEHQGQNSQTPNADGHTTDYNYGVSFSSSIHMKAYLKNSDTPFYSTKTEESKAKAGIECVGDLRNAYRVARQQH